MKITHLIVAATLLAVCSGEDAADGSCDDTFADFSECTVQSITKCGNCDAVPGPGLVPGDCSDMTWFSTNRNCCDNNECGAQFDAYESCMGCMGAEGEQDPEGSLCSEAITANTECLVQNCADFDQRCDPGMDADTCDEVESMCKNLAECCGACGPELAALLNQCTPGEGGTCNIASCDPTAEAEPTPEPPSSSMIAVPASALVTISFIIITAGILY